MQPGKHKIQAKKKKKKTSIIILEKMIWRKKSCK